MAYESMSRADLIAEIKALNKQIDAFKAVELSRDEYKDYYDNSPDMFGSIDTETGKLVQCNKAMARVLGYTKNELLGRAVMELYHPDNRESVKKLFQSLSKTGKVNNAELQMVRKDGSKLDIRLNASAVTDNHGKVLYSRSVFSDITIRKLTEKMLRASEEKYRDLFESAYDMIFLVDKNGNILNMNYKGEKLTGYKRVDLCKMNVLKDLIIDEDKPIIIQVLKDATKGKERVYEVRWKTKKGDVIQFEGATTSHFLPDGEFLSTRCILRDITDRKKSEEKLRESEDKYRTLIENLREGLIMVDNQDRIQYVNSAFCDMLGYEETELLGKQASGMKWINKEGQRLIKEKIKERKRGISNTYELEFKNKAGNRLWVQVSGAPVYNADGEVIGSFAVNTNITNLKKAEHELQKRYEQLKKYAFITSHGLRGPMSTILGLHNLIAIRKPGEPIDEEVMASLDVAMKEMDKVTREANEILISDELIKS
ncbi:MAG: PAS domain-containing protein [Flavobacteriales bacterium]|nr:PAS domain-containing protein [Flavobacteriales bacterium]